MPFPSPMHESESEVTQSCPTLSDPMECSPPGSSIHGIFQARVLEWGAIAFSIALTRRTFVGKVMSLLLNMLSRLVITFLPRSKRLLISWLQSPFAVIKEEFQHIHILSQINRYFLVIFVTYSPEYFAA